jgi:AhpD family alkylhydroperoxidase
VTVATDVRAVVGDQFIDNGHRTILRNRAGAKSSVTTLVAEVVMNSMDEIREELRQPAHDLRELIPDVMKSFAALSQASSVEGELSRLTKELLALVISATRECDGCIVAHARGALREGATRQQIAEAVGVLIALNGGPGTVWGPRALHAYDEAVAARSA